MSSFYSGNRLADVRQHMMQALAALYPPEEITSFMYLLLEHYASCTREQILAQPERTFSESELLLIHFAVKELKDFKPIQYITGKAFFRRLELEVNPDVLIPRPETEELVEWIIRDCQEAGSALSVVDIGTGSGCIALALADELKKAEVHACDISQAALHTAERNAKKNNIQVQWHPMDLLDESTWPERSFDVVVSNPPYIRESEKSLMRRNVLDWEPSLALFVPDSDPLIFYRMVLKFAGQVLQPGAAVYLEINEALGTEMRALVSTFSFGEIEIRMDINGKDRMLKAIRLSSGD